MAKVGLVAAMDFTAVPDDEFNTWYNSEHLAERQRIPGFLRCERWIGADNPKISLGSYDLESEDVLQSEGYRAIAFQNATPWTKRVTGLCQRMFRIISDQVNPGEGLAPPEAQGLLLSAVNIPPELEQEFGEWFDNEHIPALAAVPGTLSARRFVSREGSHRHLALYHLESSQVSGTEAWKAAVRTPRAEKIVPQYRDRIRILFKKPDLGFPHSVSAN